MWPTYHDADHASTMNDAYHLTCLLARAGLPHEQPGLVKPAQPLRCAECQTDIELNEVAVVVPAVARTPESLLNRDHLLDLRATMSKTEIADEYGVSVSQVEAALEAHE